MSTGRYRVIDPLQLDGKRIQPGKVVSLDEGDATDQLVSMGAVERVESGATAEAVGKKASPVPNSVAPVAEKPTAAAKPAGKKVAAKATAATEGSAEKTD